MGDRFLNEFTEFIQKPVPMISFDIKLNQKKVTCSQSFKIY